MQIRASNLCSIITILQGALYIARIFPVAGLFLAGLGEPVTRYFPLLGASPSRPHTPYQPHSPTSLLHNIFSSSSSQKSSRMLDIAAVARNTLQKFDDLMASK